MYWSSARFNMSSVIANDLFSFLMILFHAQAPGSDGTRFGKGAGFFKWGVGYCFLQCVWSIFAANVSPCISDESY